MANNPQAGTFIVVEGIDGAGSSTQSKLLVDWLNQQGRRAALTAEPTRGPIGVLLRQVLEGRVVAKRPDGAVETVHNDVIALLFAADRLDHLDCEVLPLVAQGTVVVSDRYYHSSLLYQSLQGDLAWIRQLNSHARAPDVTYVLDLPASVAAERRAERASVELYEVDDLQRRLVDGYRGLPALLPDEPIVSIDGTALVDEVQSAIRADLQERFGWE